MSLEWYKAFFEIGGVILLFLTFVFGAGALFVSGRINRIQAGELRAFQFKIEGEQQKTAKAQKEAAEAQLALEKAVASRRLTGEQKAEFTKLLKQYPDPVGIIVVSALLDPESSDFADDFDAAIKDAHWKTLRPKDRLTNKTGVSLGVAEGTPTLDQSGRPILKLKQRIAAALKAIEVPYDDVTFGKDEVNSIAMRFLPGPIYLVVEHKPPIKTTQKQIDKGAQANEDTTKK